MTPRMRQFVRRGVFTAALLALFGFALTYLVQDAIKSQNPGSNEGAPPAVVALIFAAAGFAFVAILELIAAGVRAIAPKTEPPTPKPDAPL